MKTKPEIIEFVDKQQFQYNVIFRNCQNSNNTLQFKINFCKNLIKDFNDSKKEIEKTVLQPVWKEFNNKLELVNMFVSNYSKHSISWMDAVKFAEDLKNLNLKDDFAQDVGLQIEAWENSVKRDHDFYMNKGLNDLIIKETCSTDARVGRNSATDVLAKLSIETKQKMASDILFNSPIGSNYRITHYVHFLLNDNKELIYHFNLKEL